MVDSFQRRVGEITQFIRTANRMDRDMRVIMTAFRKKYVGRRSFGEFLGDLLKFYPDGIRACTTLYSLKPNYSRLWCSDWAYGLMYIDSLQRIKVFIVPSAGLQSPETIEEQCKYFDKALVALPYVFEEGGKIFVTPAIEEE